MRREALKLILGGFALAAVAGCGFQLRGKDSIPYRSLYIDAPETSAAAKLLAQSLRSRGVTVMDAAKAADATLKLTQEQENRTVLALSGGGRVREYRLNYGLSYQLVDKDAQEILPLTTIQQSRDFTYDDDRYLAKTAEENFLFRDLRDDAVQQIVRHLSRIK